MKKVYKIFVIICIFLNVFSLFACKKVNDENVFIETKTIEIVEELEAKNTKKENIEKKVEYICDEPYEIVEINEESNLLSDFYILKNQSEGQILSIVILTMNGETIVVDGGREEDADYLYNFLNERSGNTVNYWFLTHCHDDHVGALYAMIEKYKDELYIDNIYYKFPSFQWLYEKIGSDAGAVTLVENRIKEYIDFIKEKTRNEFGWCGNIHKDLKTGYVVRGDAISIEVMNDMYLIDEDPVNNSTITYRIVTSRPLTENEMGLPRHKDRGTQAYSMLVLGDLSYKGGERLLKERGENLKSDICVVAHHGQGGVWKDVYEAIDPDICIWPTTEKIYENKEGKYRTGEVKEWFKEIGVEKHYTTVDNGIILR